MIGATILTAFNDNAAVTYLASLVPGFSDTLKYVVMAGAVTGGGLFVEVNKSANEFCDFFGSIHVQKMSRRRDVGETEARI